MCRHIAYLGPAEPLGRLLVEPPQGLYRQSWAPGRQRYGTVNADGFGVGWYAPYDRVPARYRRAGPIWADQSFADLARVVRTRALLAAVRDATLTGADAEAAAAPFTAGTWLFSHNGAVTGWPGSLARAAALLPAEELLSLEARNDSALVWALVLHRLRAGAAREPGRGSAVVPTPAAGGRRAGPGHTAGRALADTVREVAAAAPGSRLNLLLTDGDTIAATAWGDTLWYLARPRGGTVVASEPYDEDPRWREVPDRTLLVASRTTVLLTPLEEPGAPVRSPAPPSASVKESRT
ncbi:class II glutamine amidotransferase [Streptomyces sp. SCSIO 75703]|uniref:class II glutamine amidotransferase n=1 Tax=unclassified Streptomyces TaxID=2593676 RepID=UPI0004BFE5AD|nr:class II glutamine amidotransferase [Streptomyces sp. NRRL F-5065]